MDQIVGQQLKLALLEPLGAFIILVQNSRSDGLCRLTLDPTLEHVELHTVPSHVVVSHHEVSFVSRINLGKSFRETLVVIELSL